MTNVDKITDEEMRRVVVHSLSNAMGDFLRQADLCERKASLWSKFQVDDLVAEVKQCRRQAAHYQQAIDLLTEAPMPEST